LLDVLGMQVCRGGQGCESPGRPKMTDHIAQVEEDVA
jgi:hypothetical protein